MIAPRVAPIFTFALGFARRSSIRFLYIPFLYVRFLYIPFVYIHFVYIPFVYIPFVYIYFFAIHSWRSKVPAARFALGRREDDLVQIHGG